MIQFSKSLIHFLFFIIAVSILVQPGEATTMNFTVHGGEEVTKSISLAVEDRIVIKFSVVGQTDNVLNFFMACPNGTLKDFGRVGTFSYPFICYDAGEYVLHFSNKDFSEDKLVTLNYEVEHYIFGIPQMLFLTIIIVLLCMAAVATFILMGKPH
jgi:hypothetical protein